MTMRWRCTVCGYVHEGDSPPKFCPLCHATADQFEFVEEVPAHNDSRLFAVLFDELRQLREVFVPHVVFAHFPVALIPTSTLFLLLFLWSGYQPLDLVAYLLLPIVLVVVPLTFVTGLYDWKKRYQGAKGSIFRKKIGLAWCLFLLCSLVLTWRWLDPQLLFRGQLFSALFVLLHLLMLVCVTLLGHYGGVLVFGAKRRDESVSG